MGFGGQVDAYLRRRAVLRVDRREGGIELPPDRLGHDGGVAEGHLEVFVPEHLADRLQAHPILAPLDGQGVAELVTGVSRDASRAAEISDEVIQGMLAEPPALPGEQEVPPG